jgi:hypothetical protein
MSNKYANGKIYMISSPSTPDVYVGSTCKSIDQRFMEHKESYEKYKVGKGKYIASIDVISYGDSIIELLGNYPCESDQELRKHEQKHIDDNPNATNKRNAYCDVEKKKQKRNQYYQNKLNYQNRY